MHKQNDFAILIYRIFQEKHKTPFIEIDSIVYNQQPCVEFFLGCFLKAKSMR